MAAAVGGTEVIMGMYQEMVVLREQAKPFVARCRCRGNRANKKRVIQIALNDSELGARE